MPNSEVQKLASKSEFGDIEVVNIPQAQVNSGIFNLPPEFDRKAFSAHWEDKSTVVQAQPPQYAGSYLIPGWKVWKSPTGEGKEVVASKVTWVLMYRPVEIQRAVNNIEGNSGRKFLNAHFAGQLMNGQTVDNGMLTHQALSSITRTDEGLNQEQFPLNPEPARPAVERPAAANLS